jgi:hypothetical protein
MKATKKKPAKKPKPKAKAMPPIDPKAVNAALQRADDRIDQCAVAIATDKAVIATLEQFVRQHLVELLKFIITHTACKDPAELAHRALVITKWLELKTRS